NLKQASRALKQGKSMIIAGLAETKKDHAIELFSKLEVGMDELHKIAEDREREVVAPKKKEILQYVGGLRNGSKRNLKQASRALKQGKSMIISGLAETKKDHAIELFSKLEVGMDELQKIAEDREREVVAPKQKEILQYVGGCGLSSRDLATKGIVAAGASVLPSSLVSPPAK
nr:peptidyl-prolyl cis-trans isomerase CYP38, chloroplastic [Tanacetum cinerariifolium]